MSRISFSRKFPLASVCAMILTAPALAADLPPPPVPVFSWTGIYLGGQIGYAWGDNTGGIAAVTPGGLSGSGILLGDAHGVIGGAHIGYNMQINDWVLGVEGSVDGTNLTKSTLVGITDPTGATPGGSVAGNVKSDLQGSVRARVGFAWDRLLIYGTGGVAFANFSSDLNISVTDATGSYWADSNPTTTHTGWTAGGGAEYSINDHWSVRGEYRYTDFGHLVDSPVTQTPGLIFSANRHLAQNQVEFGFSYRFNSFAPVPVAARY